MFGQILDDHEFERIKVIDFSWFPNGLENDPSLPSHDNFFPVDNKNEVKALYTQRNPADKLTGKYEVCVKDFLLFLMIMIFLL